MNQTLKPHKQTVIPKRVGSLTLNIIYIYEINYNFLVPHIESGTDVDVY